jgi:hypothetical protein
MDDSYKYFCAVRFLFGSRMAFVLVKLRDGCHVPCILPIREITASGDIQVKPFARLMTRTQYSKLQIINESLYLEINTEGWGHQ